MINWRTALIGIILAVILAVIFTLVGFTAFIGYAVVGIYVGYVVGGGYKNGAIHGVIIGVIPGIIFTIINLIQADPVYLQALIGGEVGLFGFAVLLSIIFDGICGAIGGVIGASIKGSSSSNENTT
jgi:hypothetical protein